MSKSNTEDKKKLSRRKFLKNAGIGTAGIGMSFSASGLTFESSTPI